MIMNYAIYHEFIVRKISHIEFHFHILFIYIYIYISFSSLRTNCSKNYIYERRLSPFALLFQCTKTREKLRVSLFTLFNKLSQTLRKSSLSSFQFFHFHKHPSKRIKKSRIILPQILQQFQRSLIPSSPSHV